ncbi:MAG TPA: glycoside hydrolase family 6 protein, partial [Pseudonocardiaceae bacterium]|nr:glycoside hydrolase family 6 protein [Pseudonocardiaceae bacterium]
MKAGAGQRSPAIPPARVGRLALMALSLVVLGCGTGQTPTEESNPLRGLRFYVDPTSSAANQIKQWERAGRKADAEALRRIAEAPIALWVTGDPVAVEQQVRDRMAAAAEKETTPILVAYNIPGRDCGKYSAGGAPDAATYRTWMASLVRGLGDGRAVVILEPDALSHMIA